MTFSGQAFHKKTVGVLSVDEDEIPPTLKWSPVESGKTRGLDMKLDNLTSLQASKPDSPKLALKLGFENGDVILFGFRSKQIMIEIRNAIQRIIARKKSSTQPSEPVIVNTINNDVINEEFMSKVLNEDQLLKNLALQQQLLKHNPSLMKIFSDAVIKQGLDTTEFWSTRIQMLRAFAIQNNQKRGPYNVLSTIKPVASSDNQVNVNVTREKIKEIFKQYPIVRKAYDDQVPKMSEGEFWSRFFSSKLFRKLRGEKVNFHERGDVTIDKYLQYDLDYDGEENDEEISKLIDDESKKNNNTNTTEDKLKDGNSNYSNKENENENNNSNNNSNNNTGNSSNGNASDKSNDRQNNKRNGNDLVSESRKKIKLYHDQVHPVSKCLDLDANEQDDPELMGNKPDITMKKDQDPQLVNILRTMNRLSRRMMDSITNGDSSDAANNNLDLEFQKELELSDLENRKELKFNELKFDQKSNIASNILPSELIERVINQSNLNPELCEYDVFIEQLKNDIKFDFDLTCVYQDLKKPIHEVYKEINSIVKLNLRQSNMNDAVTNFTNNKLNNEGSSIEPANDNDNSNSVDQEEEDNDYEKTNLPRDVLESIKISHSTSIEFLRQFWSKFNKISQTTPQTNPNFKGDLIKLRKDYFSVKNCIERIESQINQFQESNPFKTRVKIMVDPLLTSLNTALEKYQECMIPSK